MTDAKTAKVDVNVKADTPVTSDASTASRINTPKIDVKTGIGRP